MADTDRVLYRPHEAALASLYGDLENFARASPLAFVGTPGTLLERSNASGFRYYAHQFYDATGRKVERYLAGPVGDTEAESAAQALRTRIAAAGGALKSVRLLVREGYKYVDSKAYATLAALGNHGLFRAGALVIGSHAYGVLLNKLGVRAAQYATQDVDIARDAPLELARGQAFTFLDMLKSSGLDLVPVPGLGRKQPTSSYKEAGKSYFQVDLLTPSGTRDIRTIAVPELKAHATALPYLRYLLGEWQDGVALAREGCCVARVPVAERFALHKLVVSQLRKRGEKSLKDIAQASVLLAVLAERHPGALEEAAARLPVSARGALVNGAAAARPGLAAHPRAVEFLDSLRAQ